MSLPDEYKTDWENMKVENPRFNSRAGMKIINHYFSDVRDKTIVINQGTIHQWIEKNKDKPYIQRLIQYKRIKRPHVSDDVFLREAFQIYSGGGSVRMFSPMIASWLYKRYNPGNVLDFCAGWGGRCLGAMKMGIDYTGIDTNLALIEPYQNMINSFPHEAVNIFFGDSANHIYSPETYDMVLTSPPYWKNETILTEKYENMPSYKSRTDFYQRFLIPVIHKTWKALKIGGVYVISTQHCQYEIFKSILGDATECIDYHKNGRQSALRAGKKFSIKEPDRIYIWRRLD